MLDAEDGDFLGELNFSNDFLDDLLVDDGVEVTGDIDQLFAGLVVQDVLESWEKIQSDGNIGGGQTFSDEEGFGGQDLVQVLELGQEFLLGVGDGVTVNLSDRDGWENVGENVGEEFAFSPGEPLDQFGALKQYN